MGDPASIGPEITVKALLRPSLYEMCRPVVAGDLAIMEETVSRMGADIKLRGIKRVEDGAFCFGTIDVLEVTGLGKGRIVPGQMSREAGDASFRYVEKVIELALAGKIDATVTNAISKEAVNLAGHFYSGHTEIYAEKTHAGHYAMMLVYNGLRVIHISTHVSLREACSRVKKERVLEVIRLADRTMAELGIARPAIGVAGLNPHSGEHGMFGREEITEIIPAVEAAKKEGIRAEGPVPPDTVFSKALGGWYDIVVAMYHDQGHIPLKVKGFVYSREEEKWQAVEGVNITLGLPVIRTSVDHGTAFDQAGMGTASERSLVNAIEYAVKMAKGNK
ncbi:MAG: 4-hydroxythreonine-4-phosphate dehydrogenase PdxA [Hungatella sp.]|nr:4-hydroxythreonine-4-phosphate dehydrogenase PdxA [Hungatella sp.]